MNIQTVTHNKISFVNVTSPQELEIKYLKKEFGFSPLVLDDYLNKTQIPQVEKFSDYTLVVLDFPSLEYVDYYSSNPDDTKRNIPQSTLAKFARKTKPMQRIRFGHVNFFVGKDYLVVIHDQRTPQVEDIFSKCQKSLKNRQEYMERGTVYLLYSIIDALVDAAVAPINQISGTIDFIDAQLVEARTPHVVEDISITRRNIVVFQTMIKPLLTIFSDLEKGKYKELNGEMSTYWSNVLDHVQKIWERLEDNRELIEGISLSNESILTYRNNELVKFLTVVTSISFPFVIVNNLYSMNVAGLPFATSPWIIWALFTVIFIAATGIIAYFKYRDWL